MWFKGRDMRRDLAIRHRQAIAKVVKIQRFIRKVLSRQKTKESQKHVYLVQKYMRGYLANKKVHQKLDGVHFLQKNLRMMVKRFQYRRFRQAVTRLQSIYRGKKQRKVYLERIKEKKQDKKLTLLEQRKRALLMRKKQKESVLIIERNRYAQLHRRECRMLRRYLAKLPYECRGLYFKFIDVKKSTNLLVNSFVQYMEDMHNICAGDTFEMKYD